MMFDWRVYMRAYEMDGDISPNHQTPPTHDSAGAFSAKEAARKHADPEPSVGNSAGEKISDADFLRRYGCSEEDVTEILGKP